MAKYKYDLVREIPEFGVVEADSEAEAISNAEEEVHQEKGGYITNTEVTLIEE